jgi:hypothetical protein
MISSLDILPILHYLSISFLSFSNNNKLKYELSSSSIDYPLSCCLDVINFCKFWAKESFSFIISSLLSLPQEITFTDTKFVIDVVNKDAPYS